MTVDLHKYSMHPCGLNSLFLSSPEQSSRVPGLGRFVRTSLGNTITGMYAGQIANVSGFTVTLPSAIVETDEQHQLVPANQKFTIGRFIHPDLTLAGESTSGTVYRNLDDFTLFNMGNYYPTWLEKDFEEVGVALWLEGFLTSTATDTNTYSMTSREAQKKFEQAFRSARHVDFEDGIENEFSAELTRLVRRYGAVSKESIARLLGDTAISRDVVSEALRVLGRMEDSSSHQARLWLLERGLSSPSPVVRDGAIIGLAFLDDRSAGPYLSEALKSETVEPLKRDIAKILHQLT